MKKSKINQIQYDNFNKIWHITSLGKADVNVLQLKDNVYSQK